MCVRSWHVVKLVITSGCRADGKLLPIYARLQRMCSHQSKLVRCRGGHCQRLWRWPSSSLFSRLDCQSRPVSGQEDCRSDPERLYCQRCQRQERCTDVSSSTPESRRTLIMTNMSSMNSQTTCSPISASARDPHFHSYCCASCPFPAPPMALTIRICVMC